MIKALLICNLGVSTKMLAETIKDAFQDSGEDFDLIAEPRSSLEDLINRIDLVLIAPQIAYLKDEVIDICIKNNKKYMVIPFEMYGLMDGKSVAALIRETMES